MEHSHRLFKIDDPDRPVYVVARDWETALAMWRALIRSENDIDETLEEITPYGIGFVAAADDLLLPEELKP